MSSGAPLKFSVPAPCKLNLFLYITGRRPDGYHNLQTLFTFLDCCDTLTFTYWQDREPDPALTTDQSDLARVTLTGPFDFPPERNTIVKAARLLLTTARAAGLPVKGSVLIEVDKRIPEGGGLGGGSSDAATALLTLNKLFHFNFSIKELCALAVHIGADVPVFTLGHSAFAAGVGEELTEVTVPEQWYIVAAPENCLVNTAKAFADPHLKRDSPVRSYEELMRLGPHNDFTASVVKSHPEIGQLLAQLLKYGPAHMSGSGACCFASAAGPEAAVQALNELRPLHFRALFAARSLNRSPAHDALIDLFPEG